MVRIVYQGRFGNNLFQYAFARLVNKFSYLELSTSWPHVDILPVSHPIPGGVYDHPIITITDDNARYDSLYRKGVILKGYFQNTRYFQNRELVKSFFSPFPVEHYDGIVMHLRLTDYWWHHNKSVIHHDWYHKVLRMSGVAKKPLYIVTEDPQDEYLNHFERYRPIIVSRSLVHDFYFMMGFDTIICSNSTLAWWAGYLSNANYIYTFKHWMNKIPRIPLHNMPGAIVVSADGERWERNTAKEQIDWTDYWKWHNK